MTCPWKKLAISGALLLVSVVTSAPASAGLFGNWGRNRCCQPICAPMCAPVCNSCSYGPAYPVGYGSIGNCCNTGGCASGNCGVSSYYGPVMLSDACCNNNCAGGNCSIDPNAPGRAANATPTPANAANPASATNSAAGAGRTSANEAPEPNDGGKPTFNEVESNSNKPAAAPMKTGIEQSVKPRATTPKIPADDGGFVAPKAATEDTYDEANPPPAAKPADKNARLRQDDDAEFPRARPTVNLDDKVAWKPEATRQRLTVRPTMTDARLVRAAAYPGYRNLAKTSPIEAKVAKK